MNDKVNENDRVTVITITRRRMDLLDRAIRSVMNQVPSGFYKHFILIDNCPDTLAYLESNFANNPIVYWQYYTRKPEDNSGPALLARLRTMAIRIADTKWISFLDDDNEYYPSHLISLLEFAKTNECSAVHSHYEIFHRNGEPYLDPVYPWGRTPEKARQLYKEMCEKGIITPGSNIIRDKFGVVVDTNLWLLEKKLFEQDAIPDDYDENDWKKNITEDMKLMYMLQEKGVRVQSNKKVSVKYYLGGYSNVFDGSIEGTEVWEKIAKT